MVVTHSITKKFGPYPMGHRQPNHEGHCKLIHGHNWHIELELSMQEDCKLDKCGFVFDFGNFKSLKTIFEDLFDHTFLIGQDDPEIQLFEELQNKGLVKLTKTWHPPSAEGLCSLVADHVLGWLSRDYYTELTAIRLTKVTVFEDEKNKATLTFTFDEKIRNQ